MHWTKNQAIQVFLKSGASKWLSSPDNTAGDSIDRVKPQLEIKSQRLIIRIDQGSQLTHSVPHSQQSFWEKRLSACSFAMSLALEIADNTNKKNLETRGKTSIFLKQSNFCVSRTETHRKN